MSLSAVTVHHSPTAFFKVGPCGHLAQQMRYKVLYYSAIPQARQDNLFIVRRRQGQIFDTLMMKAWMYKTLIQAAFNNTYSLGDFNLPVVAECARARGARQRGGRKMDVLDPYPLICC